MGDRYSQVTVASEYQIDIHLRVEEELGKLVSAVGNHCHNLLRSSTRFSNCAELNNLRATLVSTSSKELNFTEL